MGGETHIGLTFYGGGSLAVFEAGVAYELIRAIQFTEEKRDSNIDRIHVDVLSGTSSGGLAAFQMAAALGGRNPEKVLELMWKIWVDSVDILTFLPEDGPKGQGLLDNKILSEKARELLQAATNQPSEENFPLEEDFEVYLTLTNLNGIPEPFVMPSKTQSRNQAFPSTRYGEYARFTVKSLIESSSHDDFITAAKITAGLPAIFPPTKKKSGALPKSVEKEFFYADGGIVDNRPLGIAIDALSRRPVQNRLFFFIDPTPKYMPPQFEQDSENVNRGDPLAIVGGMARAVAHDSIFRDLTRLTEMNDTIEFLSDLSTNVYSNQDFRKVFLKREPIRRMLELSFNKAPRDLWVMIEYMRGNVPKLKTTDSVDKIEETWKRILMEPRFVLKTRILEYLDHWAEEKKFRDKEKLKQAAFALKVEWKSYLKTVNEIEKLHRKFLAYRYQIWQLVHPPRDGEKPAIKEDRLLQEIGETYDQLEQQIKDLIDSRMKLANKIMEKVGGIVPESIIVNPQREISNFLDYAQAMQVLESLAGVKAKAPTEVVRISPFDLYGGTEENLQDKRPLASGAFGNLGGFLSREWRLNDFAVGRLAMRNLLMPKSSNKESHQDALIPSEFWDEYLGFVETKDTAIAKNLKNAHRNKNDTLPDELEKFAKDPHACLLKSKEDKELKNLPARGMVIVLRRLLKSLRRLINYNKAVFPYNLLVRLNPLFALTNFILWLIQPNSFLSKEKLSTFRLVDRFRIWFIIALLILVFLLYLLIRFISENLQNAISGFSG